MRRLVDGVLLALAEGPREGGEAVVPTPPVVGVRVGAAFDKQPGHIEGRPVGQIQARVRRIEEGLPFVPPAAGVDQRGIGVQHPRDIVSGAGAGSGPDVPERQRLGERGPRSLAAESVQCDVGGEGAGHGGRVG